MQTKHIAALALIVVLLVLGGAMVVYVGGAKPSEHASQPSTPGPGGKNSEEKQTGNSEKRSGTSEKQSEKQAADPPQTIADEAEDRVAELEARLSLLARQIRTQASEGAVPFFADDFQGTPLLLATPRSAESKTYGATVAVTWNEKETEGDRSGIAPALRAFFKPLSKVCYTVFKLPKCDGTSDRLEGTLAIDVDGVEPGGAMVHAKEFYDAVFTRASGKPWVISRLARTSGRRLRNARALFVDVTESLGMTQPITSYNADLPVFMEPYSSLGGVAVADYDNDGYLDIFIPCIGRSFMFHNQGDGTFKEVSGTTGTDSTDAGASAIFFDYDNDGLLDLLIANFEPEMVPSNEKRSLVKNATGRALTLLRNKGDGTFEDVTRRAGLTTYGTATSVCAADVNRDGTLDIFVCMYHDFGKQETAGMIPVPSNFFGAKSGVGCQLWINQGDGTFKEEAEKRGVKDMGWSFAAAFCDYDDSGWPSLYVVNDYGENRLYHNKGNGYFEDATAKAGTADLGFGMGVSWGDYDACGRMDLYVSDMYSTAGNRVLGRGRGALTEEKYRKALKMAAGNTLYRNKGDGTFEDVTKTAGVGKAGWAWGSAFFDYTLTGWPGLYVANGYVTGESDPDL